MNILFSRDGKPLVPNAKDAKGKPLRVQDRICWRCGGMGGAEAWRHTGWKCYRCDGNGVDPVRERVKLYTEDQLVKLNERKARLDATRAAAKAERDRVEAERRAAEKAEIISEYQGLLDRIDAELAHEDHEILRSVKECICERVKDPSDRQLEVVENIIASRTRERARRAAAQHVGQIKERRDFTLTLLYTRSTQTGRFPTIWSHWSLFTDENGCKIASKSPPWVLGLVKDGFGPDADYKKQQVIRVKATVVDHATDKNGEPITYINRPKELG